MIAAAASVAGATVTYLLGRVHGRKAAHWDRLLEGPVLTHDLQAIDVCVETLDPMTLDTNLLRLPVRMAQTMIEHAEREAPSECVGLVGFDVDGQPALLAPCHNRCSAPEHGFFVEPYEQYRIEQQFGQRGCYLGAIYHSHPTTPAEPSATDLEWVPDNVISIIVSLASADTPVIRAWSKRDELTLEEA